MLRQRLAFAASLLLLAAGTAQAGQLTFQFRSNHQYSVAIEFTSQDRNHQCAMP